MLQETLVTVFKSLEDFRQEASLSTWLYTIARSFCIKKRRKEGRSGQKPMSLHQLETHTSLPKVPAHQDAEVQTKETWQSVAMAMDRLEPSHREILLLRDIQGLSTKEVAQVLHLSVAATKSRLHRARANLRDLMTPTAPSGNCPGIRQIFSQYLEGDLKPGVCSEMQDHLATCSQCRTECDHLKRLLHICQTAPDETVPAEIAEKIRQSLRSALNLGI